MNTRRPRSGYNRGYFSYSNQKYTGNVRRNKNNYREVYGKYHCKYCDVHWISQQTEVDNKGREAYGQECRKCGYEIYAYYIHDCKNRPCRCEYRVFGHYQCNCGRAWSSAYTFEARGSGYILYGQECQVCGVDNDAIYTEKLMKGNMYNEDPNKTHNQELCGRCRHKSQPCTSGTDEEYGYGDYYYQEYY